MIPNIAALVAGVWCLQQQSTLPDFAAAVGLVPLGALWLVLARREDVWSEVARRLVAVLWFAIAGFFWAGTVGHWKLADALAENWQGRDIEITGTVAGLTQPADRGVRFTLDVEHVHVPGAEVPSQLSLVWYRSDVAVVPDLRAGQVWRMTVRLRRPHGNFNPHGFDFEAWMLERGLRASGYVRAEPPPRLLSALRPHPGYLLDRVREAIRDKLLRVLDGQPHAGVIVALAIGDQRAIAPGQWQVFTRTGVNHLMSISGLHITMIASLVFLLTMRLWRVSATLSLRLPAVRAATVAGMVAAVAYAALAGFAVPAQRTVFMLGVVGLALWLGWQARPLAILSAAAALVVLLDPIAVISPGFWLSFGAVAIIMLAGGARVGRAGWIVVWARTQWAVTLALVPLLLAMFQQVSLVSPVANAFAIPLVSLVVVPISLMASLLPLDWPAHLAHAVLQVGMRGLEWLGALPDAAWQQHAPPAWSVPVGLLGALWLLLPRGFPARWTGIALMIPLFLSVPPRPREGELWLTVLDVGQGLAVVAQTQAHALLFDAGPAFSEQVSAGERIVVPFLRGAGIGRLDGLIVSHDDLDHSGGAAAVLQALPVGWMASSLPADHPLRALPSGRVCAAGDRWHWDGVEFEILHPDTGSYNEPEHKDNDLSCVLRIVSPHGSVLLPADIERRAEARLLRVDAERLAADVLVVPHHGSRTSSTPEFVRAVSPQLAIFAVGYGNHFGHPHPLVAARYRTQGVRLLRTDSAGAVSVQLTAAGVDARTWRGQAKRYWQD